MDVKIEGKSNYGGGECRLSTYLKEMKEVTTFIVYRFLPLPAGEKLESSRKILLILILASNFAQFLTNIMIEFQSNLSSLGVYSFQIIAVNWLSVLVFEVETFFFPKVHCILNWAVF